MTTREGTNFRPVISTRQVSEITYEEVYLITIETKKKSGKFSHHAVKKDGETIADVARTSVHVMFGHASRDVTMAKLKAAGHNPTSENKQGIRFGGVDINEFCRVMGIPVPSNLSYDK